MNESILLDPTAERAPAERARLARLQATVDLYKALGGGWERAD